MHEPGSSGWSISSFQAGQCMVLWSRIDISINYKSDYHQSGMWHPRGLQEWLFNYLILWPFLIIDCSRPVIMCHREGSHSTGATQRTCPLLTQHWDPALCLPEALQLEEGDVCLALKGCILHPAQGDYWNKAPLHSSHASPKVQKLICFPTACLNTVNEAVTGMWTVYVCI